MSHHRRHDHSGGRLRHWHGIGLVGIVLIWWLLLALVLVHVLPDSVESTPRTTERVTQGNVQRWRSNSLVRLEQVHPCTGGRLVLDVTLSLDIKASIDGEDAQVLVVAVLTNHPSADAPDRVSPVRKDFSFLAPLYGQPSDLDEVRAALLGQVVPADLIVPIKQGVDGSGHLTIQTATPRITCT